VTLLPHPDSPTRATISPAHVEGEAVDDLRLLARRRRKRDGELPYGEEWRAAAGSSARDDSGRVCYGSAACRRPESKGEAASSPAAGSAPVP